MSALPHPQITKINDADIVVSYSDFQNALKEVEPRLGINTDELGSLFRNGIVPYGPSFDSIITTLRRFVQQVRIRVRGREEGPARALGR